MDWSGSFAIVFLFYALFLCIGPFWQLIIRFVQFRSRRVGQCSTPSTASTTWMILISLSRVWYYTALPSETKSRIVISAALSWKSVCGWGELDRSISVFVLIKYTASEDTLRGMRCLLVCVCLHPISWGETWNRWDRREPFRHQWRSYGLQDERSLVYSSIISCMCKLWSTTGSQWQRGAAGMRNMLMKNQTLIETYTQVADRGGERNRWVVYRQRLRERDSEISLDSSSVLSSFGCSLLWSVHTSIHSFVCTSSPESSVSAVGWYSCVSDKWPHHLSCHYKISSTEMDASQLRDVIIFFGGPGLCSCG